MVTSAKALDQAFHGLANATRRGVIEQLRRGPASVSELAEPFDMALPSFMQHLQSLEQSGLVTSRKHGRIRTVSLRPVQIERAASWLLTQRDIWERRLDQLDAYLDVLEEKE